MTASQLLDQLLERGTARPVPPRAGAARAAAVNGIEVAQAAGSADGYLRARWRERVGNTGRPYLLVADDPPCPGRVRVLGPTSARGPVRPVDAKLLAEAVERAAGRPGLLAVRGLAEDLARIGRSGLVVNGLLTEHMLEHRFKNDPSRWEAARDRVRGARPSHPWRRLLAELGYAVERLPRRGYLARHDDKPVAVVHPKAEDRDFARLDSRGRPPEGLLVADCNRCGAPYGMLVRGSRFRLFDAESAAPASAWLELDLRLLGTGRMPFLALLAPEYLVGGGLAGLRRETRAFGIGLRDRLDRTIREEALPALAEGMQQWARQRRIDLADDLQRLELQRAALTLVFRIVFILFGESAGHLPMSNRTYRRASLSSLVREAKDTMPKLSLASAGLWAGFARLVKAMRTGNPAWDLPAYNGALFAETDFDGAELLERMELRDPAFARVLVAIGQDQETGHGVDFSTLEIAHIGHTYEALLGLRMSLAKRPLRYDGRKDLYVSAADGEAEVATGGLLWQTHRGGRKAGGVYYTPVEIVRHLVRRAVKPAFDRHLARVADTAGTDPVRAARDLLSFSVVDPACGSAHFLVQVAETLAEATVRFLAEHPLPSLRETLDRLRSGATPGAEIEDTALLRRLIVKHCVYGVDISPMGAEVATLSLWLASFVPGLSLAYLGRNVVVGDALIGVGSPKAVINDGQLFEGALREALAEATEAVRRVAESDDRTPGEIAGAKAADEEAKAATAGLRQLFDLWTAEQFGLDGARELVQLHGADVITGRDAADGALVRKARELAGEHRFLHWPLAFPQVFSRRREGFDVVVGNPPWEEVTVEELSFYGMYRPGINSLSEAERGAAVRDLVRERPGLPQRLANLQGRLANARSALGAGDYKGMKGDPDLYKYFCQRYRMLARDRGFIGVVLPRTAFQAKGSQGFRKWLFRGSTTHRVDFLLNRARWIFDSEPRYSIALLVAEHAAPDAAHRIEVAGTARSRLDWERQAAKDGVRLSLSSFGPGGETPLVRSQEEADLLARLRVGGPFPLGGGRWSCFPVRELDETNDKKLWRGGGDRWLWKGASFGQYDPHGDGERPCPASAAVLKKVRKPRPGLKSLLAGGVPLAERRKAVLRELDRARVAFRDVTNRTNTRTVIAALIPPGVFLANTAPYLAFASGGVRAQAACLGVMNSLPFDWQARRFVEIHVSFFLLEGLVVPNLTEDDFEEIARAAARLSAVNERFPDFASATGVDTGPLHPSDRRQLRCEIDARVARAWKLTPADLDVIFADFTAAAVPPAYRLALSSRLAELV